MHTQKNGHVELVFKKLSDKNKLSRKLGPALKKLFPDFDQNCMAIFKMMTMVSEVINNAAGNKKRLPAKALLERNDGVLKCTTIQAGDFFKKMPTFRYPKNWREENGRGLGIIKDYTGKKPKIDLTKKTVYFEYTPAAEDIRKN